MPDLAGCRPAVLRARALGKQNDRPSGQQTIQNGLESFSAATVAIDGNHLPLVQNPAEDGKAEQVFASEIIDPAPDPGAEPGVDPKS